MVRDNLMQTELLAFSKLHYAFFLNVLQLFIQLINNLISCERHYLKTRKNVTDHFSYIYIYILSDIYYYSDL